MNGAEYIAHEIDRRGVTHVFELVGGMITFLIDALHERTRVKVVSMHHEQGAGFAAEGFGRMRGVPGVALATSGPGATNLLTAIGSCFFDSTPAVFITGQVNRAEMKGSRAIRQLGFQETDIVSMARPVTKLAELVLDPADLPSAIERAFRIAVAGRPGPVLLDVPMDVQRATVPETHEAATSFHQDDASPDGFWRQFQDALSCARRPLLLAGGGVRAGRAVEEFRTFAHRLGVPVVHSLMGVDVLAADNPLRVGLIGSYGNRWANLAISESDLLLVLGSRLDVRQTGSDTKEFKGRKQVFHVDCEAGEMNNRVSGCVTLVSDLSSFFERINGMPVQVAQCDAWVQHLVNLKARWPDTAELESIGGINPNRLMHQLSHAAIDAAAFVTDVGQHQQWAAQSLRLRADQRFMTSGGMGAMGFALPAAVGASLASGRQVVMIAGDGGFQLNMQELQTIVRLDLPVKMIVIDNACHGMVRQFQQSYFKGRYHSTMWGYSAPDFERVAEAYGIAASTISEPHAVEDGLANCFRDHAAPYLLVAKVDSLANAYPKLAFGRPISQMEPQVRSIEMEGT